MKSMLFGLSAIDLSPLAEYRQGRVYSSRGYSQNSAEARIKRSPYLISASNETRYSQSSSSALPNNKYYDLGCKFADFVCLYQWSAVSREVIG
jgi:hypothetical protein